MDKYGLIRAVSDNIGIPKITCEAVIDEFIAEARRNIIQGNEISLNNFLTIKIKDRPAQNGYDIINHKPGMVPATKVVKCKISQSIIDAVKSRGIKK